MNQTDPTVRPDCEDPVHDPSTKNLSSVRPGVWMLSLAVTVCLAAGLGCSSTSASDRGTDGDADRSGSDGMAESNGTDGAREDSDGADGSGDGRPDTANMDVAARNRDGTESGSTSSAASSRDAVQRRIDLLRSRYRWPDGFYPYPQRSPQPDLEEGTQERDGWDLVSNGAAQQTDRAYREAVESFALAMQLLPQADHALLYFNIAASHQRVDGKRAEAIANFERAITAYERHSMEGDIVWNDDPFRHSAAAAVAQLHRESESPNLERAFESAFDASVRYPMRDWRTNRPIEGATRMDPILPAVYVLAGLNLNTERDAVLRRLLTDASLRLAGTTPGDLLAGLVEQAISQAEDIAGTVDAPAIYSRDALSALVEQFETLYPNHSAMDRIRQLAQQQGL